MGKQETAAVQVPSVEKSSDRDGVVDTSINRYNVCNLIAYVVNCFVTFSIGTFGAFGRPTNGDLSDKYQTIVTPFGTSFSIWGMIFGWQAFWIVWQFFPNQRNSEGLTRAWYYYPLMTIVQAGWTTFSYELMWLAAVFMYIILITLIRQRCHSKNTKKPTRDICCGKHRFPSKRDGLWRHRR